ncbi:MAG: class I SAM-dependent methyltransferase [Ignavibacteriae bacterium]|nr:class I SAM-dependent methyltransferase [Ignavibacteriota bacterium]
MEEKNKNIIRKFSKPIDMRMLNRTPDWRLGYAIEQKSLAEKYFQFTNSIQSCPICESTEKKIFTHIYQYPYYECVSCSHIYCGLLPDYNKIIELYNSNDNNKNIQDKEYIGEEIFTNRIKNISLPKLYYINEQITERGLWVDIGCGVGEILYCAKQSGWDVLGFESDKLESSFAKSKGIEIIEDFLNENNAINYSDIFSKAKVISFINILEHIPNPGNFLSSITNLIKDESYVVIEVPRHPSLSSLNCSAFPELVCRHIYPPDHLHIFTEKSLEIMLNNAGLEIQSVWYFGQDFYDLMNCIMTNEKNINIELADKIISLTNKFQEIIDREMLSDAMLVITKKI